MRFDPQIASRFEQMELPASTESDELRRFVAGYLATLDIRKNPAEIAQRFIQYVGGGLISLPRVPVET